MITVIYNKTTLQTVGTLASNETIEQAFKEAVFNFKGTTDDYAALAVPFEYFRLEEVDGEVVAVETEAPSNTEELSPIEKLEQENAELRAVVTAASSDLESFLIYYFTTAV